MLRLAWGALLLATACQCRSAVPHRVERIGNEVLLVSPSGWQTVSEVDGGPTGLYYDVAEELLRGQPGISRVALLGLGGGEMLKGAHRAQPTAALIGVEIDEHTVGLALSEFGMGGQGDFTAITGDALVWIAAQPPRALDVVMVDLYNDSSIVEASTQEPFISNCARSLRPFGLYVQNVFPPSRAGGIETALAPYFETERKSYGANVVITGMRRP